MQTDIATNVSSVNSGQSESREAWNTLHGPQPVPARAMMNRFLSDPSIREHLHLQSSIAIISVSDSSQLQTGTQPLGTSILVFVAAKTANSFPATFRLNWWSLHSLTAKTGLLIHSLQTLLLQEQVQWGIHDRLQKEAQQSLGSLRPRRTYRTNMSLLRMQAERFLCPPM